MPFKQQTYLLIPDSHSKKGDKFERFRALKGWLHGRNVKLDGLVHIGDGFDFESLCTHDAHLPEWFDRELTPDIETGMKALDHLDDIVRRFGKPGARAHFLEGNHEVRYNRWMAGDNRLRHSPFPQTVADLIKYYRPSTKINYVPFLKPLIINDIAFSHYFVSGLMGRAQSGERPAGTILKAQHMSCVCGHSHTLDYAERTRADGRKIHGLVAGCFIDPNMAFDFAGAARKLWWVGCHLLHFVKPGEFDVESISLERM